MNASAFRRNLVLLAGAILAQLPATASACTACMGDPSSKNAGAINSAIFLMLGCIGAMLCGLGAFAYFLMKRANTPLPPHVAMVQMISAEGETQ